MQKQFLTLMLLSFSFLNAETSTQNVTREIRLRNAADHVLYPGVIVKYIYQDGTEKLKGKGFDELLEEGQEKLFVLAPKATITQSPVVAIELVAIGCSATPNAENPTMIEVAPFGVNRFEITEIETPKDHEAKVFA